MRKLLFRILFFTAVFYGVLPAFGQKKGKEKVVPAFVYHRFGDDRYPSTNISDNNFESHLKYLSEQGYESLTLSQAIQYLSSGKYREKVVCLTVDDGFQSFYENGLPLLQKYGFTATVFVNTSYVGLKDYMNWETLSALKEAGIEIGNHSHSHDFFLNDSSETRLESFANDLMKNQGLMEDNLDHRPTVYAYPYGEFDEGMKKVVADSGYYGAAIQSSGVMHAESDRYQLPRFPMSDRYGKLGSFIEKLGMSPIRVTAIETKDWGYNGSPDNPTVIIRFPVEDLRLRGIQCFAAGERCTKSVRVDKDGNVQLTIKSKTPLNFRRTLYTVTVPDQAGKWHWFSYTWVNKELKD